MSNERRELEDLTAKQIAEIEAMPCDMYHEPPYDFAWCERHDTTFPLGDVCRYQKQNQHIADLLAAGTLTMQQVDMQTHINHTKAVVSQLVRDEHNPTEP